LLAPEIERARASKQAPRALIDQARGWVQLAVTARADRDLLVSEIASLNDAPKRARLEAWLRATTSDAKALSTALRALRRGDPEVLDSATITERVARTTDAFERQAEAYLCVACEAESGELGPADAASLLALARIDGRWSRRVEALALFARCFRLSRPLAAEALELRSGLAELILPREHRWVQVAAFGALRQVDRAAATEAALVRLRARIARDDFLVRTGILRVFSATREGCPVELIDVARTDPSVSVRCMAVAAERRVEQLEGGFANDESAKVRASALLRFARRAGTNAFSAIARALRTDADGLVVRAALTSLRRVAARPGFAAFADAARALEAAKGRRDLPHAVLAGCHAAMLAITTTHRDADTLRALRFVVRDLPPGSSARTEDPRLARVDESTLAKAIAIFTEGDFPLGVSRLRSGLRIYRGESTRFSLSRVLHELRHPTPTKRQTVSHATSRSIRGELRAPPALLAEATATTVPGERVLVESAGGWGRHLPRIDDLLDACSIGRAQVVLADARGTVTIHAPRSLSKRLRARASLTFRFAEWAALRQRSLASSEPDARRGFVRALASELDISLRFSPHTFDPASGVEAPPIPDELDLGASEVPSSVAAMSRGALASSLPPAVLGGARGHFGELWNDFVDYATWRTGGHLAELALYAGILLALWVVRAAFVRQAIEADRSAMALVIGGWGTRGKSGTERLKAGMFQGLGFENLVKTTGCEAMFIHSMPGVPASEVFIYRPYDKATVWEQRDVLRLARRFDVRTMLWECMALQPDLVNLLQCQWMRDDLSTITNAYPDHEDVQGPTGYDVASTITEFVPERGRLFTTERQMLPLFENAAKQRGSSVIPVRDLEVDLIPDDLLARFGHQEHPSNIALVARIANHFGVPAFVAMAEMADNVVADLGALKTFPAVAWLGRTLAFTNGMGANDRAGTLGNFERSGLAALDPDTEPERWVVTVVNNRADRVSRSEVFARLLVEAVRARRHVLIGTNVSGLRGFLDEALGAFLANRSPVRDLPDRAEERLKTAHARIDDALSNLALGATTAASFEAEASACGWPSLDVGLLDSVLRPASALESYGEALRAIEAKLPRGLDAELTPFVVEALARRRTKRALHAAVDEHLLSAPDKVEAAFSAAYRAMFEATLVALHDPSLSGDAIIESVARAVAPGVHASVIGVQNIKGTGLDFVYRWVSMGRVSRLLEGLGSSIASDRSEALRGLAAHDDYGIVDATIAREAVRRARQDDAELGLEAYDAVEAVLSQVIDARAAKHSTGGKRTGSDRFKNVLRTTLDFADAVLRRSAADRVVDDLTAGVISHATAARRMRSIIERGKGK
jgi:poly-gamma-glutamate synthase PgsB/CapB